MSDGLFEQENNFPRFQGGSKKMDEEMQDVSLGS